MTGLTGVDVSSFQGQPGQWQAAAGSYSWAAVKITELGPGPGGLYVNPDAGPDWAALAEWGKLRAAYLFGHPSVSAAGTVAAFAGHLGQLGVRDTDAVALDLEVADGLPAAAVAGWAAEVLAGLETEFGRLPLIYTYLSFARAGNCAGLGRWPLWISDPSSPAGRPQVPAPWSAWALHQYVITSPIDRDVACYPTLAAMAAALGRRPAPPAPEPPPVLPKGPGMIMIQPPQTGVPAGTTWPGVNLLLESGQIAHVPTATDVAAWRAAGVPEVIVSWAQWEALTARPAAISGRAEGEAL